VTNVTHKDTPAQLAARLAQLSPEKRVLLKSKHLHQRRSGFDLVARSLQECGMTHIYGVAGLPSEPLFGAGLGQGIRPIGVYHQTATVLMSMAHNYQAGGLVAATLVSAGPAITNAITGLLVARHNGWPGILLGGRRSSFQACDAIPMVRHVTKHAVAVRTTSSIRARVREACQIAVAGRPGPVYVELHEEALHGSATDAATYDQRFIATVSPLTPISDAEVKRVADALLSARRPALLLGKGIRWTVVPHELAELIERLGVPFMTSPMGRGFIPDDHPLCFNQARTTLESQTDVVVVFGARLNWVFRHGAGLSREACVFHVDIHRDIEDDAAVETNFIHADAGRFVTQLLESVRSRDFAAEHNRLGKWHNTLRAASAETRRLLERRICCDVRPMSAYRMMKEVRDALPRDAICVTEGNISMKAAQAVIPAFQPASRMDAGSNACMGVGILMAIGAKVACPKRPVVAIVGDYGFSLSAMEMEVCLRHHVPIVVIVANNRGNNGALKQRKYFPVDHAELVTMFQPGIEYDRLMKMFGGRGATIDDPGSVKPTIEEAIESAAPTCINVVIDSETPDANAWGEQA